MKQAFNTALEGVAFAIIAGYERRAYVGSLNGGVIFRQRAWLKYMIRVVFATRGRGGKGYIKQQMEILGFLFTNTITTVQKDNMLLEIYDTNTASNKWRIYTDAQRRRLRFVLPAF